MSYIRDSGVIDIPAGTPAKPAGFVGKRRSNEASELLPSQGQNERCAVCSDVAPCRGIEPQTQGFSVKKIQRFA